MSREHILLVTGKLAEPSLRRTLAQIQSPADTQLSVAVLPITVVALATTSWIANHLHLPEGVSRVVLPGLCAGDVGAVANQLGIRVERGPADLLDLPEFFSQKQGPFSEYGGYDIQILAEINHAHSLSRRELVEHARRYRASGADIIDLGCDPGSSWLAVGDAVRALRDEGLHVSIDSFDRGEVTSAVAAGAELVLSVNQTNVDAAMDWDCEVVAVPDEPATLGGLDATVEKLARHRVRFRIDPVLEPIGFGFAASLARYGEIRRRYPGAEMLMGVGNLTELTAVDSAGVNLMLLGICQEWGVRSVLTTEVINWCRSAVRELDLARRLVHHACRNHVLPKHRDQGLVLLRDPRLRERGEQTLAELAGKVTDKNFRLFAERGHLHVINHRLHFQGTDPFELFRMLSERTPVDPAHAFYLGYEMAKAVTALTLGKNYVQDHALQWGFLTLNEPEHRDTIAENREQKPGVGGTG